MKSYKLISSAAAFLTQMQKNKRITLYKYIPLKTDSNYAINNLKKGQITATKISRLRQYYPDEMIGSTNPPLLSSYLNPQECSILTKWQDEFLGDNMFITCFTQNNDFKNGAKLEAYGQEIILAEYYYHDIVKRMIFNALLFKLCCVPAIVSYYHLFDNFANYGLALSYISGLINNGVDENTANEKAVKKFANDSLLLPLIRKDPSFLWENEVRFLYKYVPTYNPGINRKDEIYPVVATCLYPTAIYYSPCFLSETSPRFEELKEFTRTHRIPLIKKK